MVKKLIATAALVAGLAFLAPASAGAATLAGTYNVPAGTTVCVTSTGYAYSSARGEGSVVAGHLVRFTFAAAGPTYTTLADSGVPVAAFAADASPYTHPSAFPGRFKTCAVNQSQKASTVYLSVETN